MDFKEKISVEESTRERVILEKKELGHTFQENSKPSIGNTHA